MPVIPASFFGVEYTPQRSGTLRYILRSKEKHGEELIGHRQRNLS
jgi:hypothetical protein